MIDNHTIARFASSPSVQFNTVKVLSGAAYAVMNGLAHSGEAAQDRWLGTHAEHVAAIYCALAACRDVNPEGPITIVVEDMILCEQPPPARDEAITLIDAIRCADFTHCEPPHPVERVMKWHHLYELAAAAIRASGPTRPLAVTLEQHLDALGGLD